jgi:CBS domain-containing protein
MEYKAICIYTNEDARWQGKPLADAVINLLRERRLAARCLVTRAIAGCDENGETATQRVEVLSYNLPIRIEIILPAAEVEGLLTAVAEMVTEGVVGVSNLQVVSHKVRHRLIPRQMKVRDVMTPAPKRTSPEATLDQVLEILLKSDFTGLPVVDDNQRPVGIITDGDLLYRAGIPIRVRLLAEFANDDIQTVKLGVAHRLAKEVMTTPVVTVEQDQFLFEAVATMLKRDLRRLPVVDAKGALVGILSRIDIFKAINRQAPTTSRLQGNGVILSQLRQAGDAMRKDTPTVSPDTPLEEVIKLLGNSAIERVAVVDGQGGLLGLISDRAMLEAFSEHKQGIWDYLVRKMSSKEMGRHHSRLIRQYRVTTAGQVMETKFPSVRADTPLEEAVQIMTDQHLKRLPVLDEQGKFLGMLRREALLRLETGGAAPDGQG